MKYARLLIPVCIISFLFLSIGNSLLAVTDPVESNYALTAKEMVLLGTGYPLEFTTHFGLISPSSLTGHFVYLTLSSAFPTLPHAFPSRSAVPFP